MQWGDTVTPEILVQFILDVLSVQLFEFIEPVQYSYSHIRPSKLFEDG